MMQTYISPFADDFAVAAATPTPGNDVITGTAANNVIDALAGNDVVYGRAGNDEIYGNIGIDRLYGEAGTDQLDGGAGNDSLYGGANEDWLYGNAGNDILDGGTGADLMGGGAGNDIFYIDNPFDGVDETASTGGSGIDTVRAYISVNLANTNMFQGQIENLQVLGTAALNLIGNGLANALTGNNAANVIAGGAGNDRLAGLGGNDILRGGAGNDTLTGGAGNDTFVFETAPNATLNRDVITDFTNAAGNNDTIRLDNAVFTKLGAAVGPMNAAFFKLASQAQDANDYVIYNPANGALYYDSNANAAGGAVQIALLSTRPTLTAADFFII